MTAVEPPAAARDGRRTAWLLLEGIAWVVAIAALVVWGVASLAGLSGAREDIQRFEDARAERHAPALSNTPAPDLRLWDEGRVRAWRAALAQPAPTPLAVLRIPRIDLEVAVLPGTGAFALNRGVGHIDGTSVPGANGNSGIAGHRDGFFRGLKDLEAGDTIELETVDGRQAYRVDRTWVVDPADVSVLNPTPVRALTLVTCYPFYFIGSAPQRFIVRAVASGAPGAVSRR